MLTNTQKPISYFTKASYFIHLNPITLLFLHSKCIANVSIANHCQIKYEFCNDKVEKMFLGYKIDPMLNINFGTKDICMTIEK